MANEEINKDKAKVNKLVDKLFWALFVMWQKHRKEAGFQYSHEQKLYDALREYQDKERERHSK